MSRGDVLLRVVAWVLLGPAVMVAAGLITKGYVEVGDGFAAGVIVALAVSLSYITRGAGAAEAGLPILRHAPKVAVAGLALALAGGFFPLLAGNPPFSHEPPPGRPVITFGTLELITPVVFDAGIFLLVVGLVVTLLHQLTPDPRPRREGGETGTTHSGGPW